MPEEWGGDTVMVEVSAKTKKNLPKLLEMILLVGDLRELKADPGVPASGTVLESRVDKGRGPVATMLVQNGTLHVGDVFIVGAVYGKVRAMFDDRGGAIKQAGPSTPVEVLGLQGVPEAGDQFQVADEAKARHIVEYRQGKAREATLAKSASGRLTLDQLHEQLKIGEVKELPVVVKADVQGSVEVLNEMLPKLSNDQVKLKVIHASVGAVNESDVLLASTSNAVIVAFNVRPERKAAELAQREGVDIRTHTIIYELLDELQKAVEGLLAPVIKEQFLGRAEVRDTFRVKGVGTIAGCSVLDGIIRRDAEVRVIREGAVIYTGRVSSLKRFKDDVKEVRQGFECGIGVSNFADVKVGDVLECFQSRRLSASTASARSSTAGSRCGRRTRQDPVAQLLFSSPDAEKVVGSPLMSGFTQRFRFARGGRLGLIRDAEGVPPRSPAWLRHTKMPIGLLTLEIHILDAQSLKDKRQVLRSLKDRLRAHYNVAVAELEHQETWQRSRVGVVTISGDVGFSRNRSLKLPRSPNAC